MSGCDQCGATLAELTAILAARPGEPLCDPADVAEALGRLRVEFREDDRGYEAAVRDLHTHRARFDGAKAELELAHAMHNVAVRERDLARLEASRRLDELNAVQSQATTAAHEAAGLRADLLGATAALRSALGRTACSRLPRDASITDVALAAVDELRSRGEQTSDAREVVRQAREVVATATNLIRGIAETYHWHDSPAGNAARAAVAALALAEATPAECRDCNGGDSLDP